MNNLRVTRIFAVLFSLVSVLTCAQTSAAHSEGEVQAGGGGYMDSAPHALMLNAAGSRAIRTALSNAPPQPTQFSLHALDLKADAPAIADFMMAKQFPYQETRISISTEGLHLARQWSAAAGAAQTAIPADVPDGVYVLTANFNEKYMPPHQLIIGLTRVAVLLKRSGNDMLAFVTGMDGRPVAGAAITAYSADGEPQAQGVSNADGLWRFTMSSQARSALTGWKGIEPGFVAARSGASVSLVGLSESWDASSHYSSWYPPVQSYAGYVYTDRPIYKPGQTIFFKAILRKDADAALSVPAPNTKASVILRDSRNNQVFSQTLALDEFGALNGQMTLGDEVSLGDYALLAQPADGRPEDVFRALVQVQQYHAADFGVHVSLADGDHIANAPISLTVSAAYFHGAPVQLASVKVRFISQEVVYSWESQFNTDRTAWMETEMENTSGQTDAQGNFTLQTKLPAKAGSYYYEAEVQDQLGQLVAARAPFTIANSIERWEFGDGPIAQAVMGQPYTVSAKLVGRDGAPVSGRLVQLLATFNEQIDSFSDQSLTLQTNAQGYAVKEDGALPALVFSRAGEFVLIVRTADPFGKLLIDRAYVHVSRTPQEAPSAMPNAPLSMAAPDRVFEAGQTAPITITSTFSGAALLSTERGQTRSTRIITLNKGVNVISYAIQQSDAPNVFVSVSGLYSPPASEAILYSSLTPPELARKVAEVNLHVKPTNKTLSVEVVPVEKTYAPREEAIFVIRVKDERGQPVAASVSAALVDEAVFALADDQNGAAFDALFYPRANRVQTLDSSRTQFGIPGGMGGGGGGGGYMPLNPRQNFPDTALWLPDVRTDKNGVATLKTRLPDSLTSWRLTARAVTRQTQVGDGSANITVTQPIAIQPLLPASLVEGDEFLLSALAQNKTDLTQTLVITASASGFVLKDAAPVSLTLRPGEQRVVGFAARAGAAGAGVARVSARAGGMGDATQVAISIQQKAVIETLTRAGQTQTQAEENAAWPPSAIGMGKIVVSVERNLAGAMFDGLEYLTGYPYGCVEQTMSKALPNIVVARAFKSTAQTARFDPALSTKVGAGLQRLLAFQHQDGGWGWWLDDASDPYQTAWVVFGLSTATQAGYPVDGAVIRRGAAYLNTQLAGMDPRAKAFVLYGMAAAGQGNPSATLEVAQKSTELDAFSRASLALALRALGEDAEAAKLADALVSMVTDEGDAAFWPENVSDGVYQAKMMASSVRSTAQALRAVMAIRPNPVLEAKITRWLMRQRAGQGWGTTNETAFTLLALTDYVTRNPLPSGAAGYKIFVDGALAGEGSLDGKTESAQVTATLQTANPANVRVVSTNGGTLFYRVQSQAMSKIEDVAARGAISLTRDYTGMGGQSLREFGVGDLVQVRIAITVPRNLAYVMIEDNTPGGLAPINERLNTSPQGYGQGNDYLAWQTLGYNRKEIRDGRVTFFITDMPKGVYVFTYLARASQLGAFTALPVNVSAMYDPQTWGRSNNDKIAVTPFRG